jgi:hypothetical protein
LGSHATAVDLLELATHHLWADRSRFNVVRALLSSQLAGAPPYVGLSALPEVRHALALSEDLYDHAGEDDREQRV